MQSKLFLTAALIMAATLLTSTVAIATVDAQEKDKKQSKDDKKKPQKCNNVKLRVTATGVEENDTLIGVAHLGGVTVAKTVTVAENQTNATLPFNFKKIDPCPETGSMFHGFVNGTEFETELKSIKTPNKVDVDL